MKKTWKCWLGTVAAAMLGGTVMAQPPQGPGFGSDLPFGDEGAVRLGDVSGSATTGGPATAQFDLVRPLDADAVWGEAPLAYQGAPPPGDESVGFASAASYADVQWRVGRVNNDMYGFNGGYTTLNAFIPLVSDDRNLWFMDPRLNITDYGEGAANFGIGYRRYSYAMDRIFGASAWYDYDPGHRAEYHQLGLSLENIGRYWSTRFNANVPLSDQNDFTNGSSFGNPFFVGNNIGYIFSFLRETTYQNYTVEAAAPVPFFGRYGWEWGISGYGLVSNGDSGEDAIGIGGRFEWQVAQDFWINTTITHDRIFGTNTSINFELTIPSGKQTRWLRPMRVHDKILASVKRPYRVSTSTSGQSENRLFLDPNDGAPIVVAHINPQAANGAAAGSVENPFGSVQDYMNLTAGQRSPFDIIYVGGNLLATNDADLNTTIELLDRQRLLGTGALADGSVHQFQTIARSGVGFETLALPNFGNSATATNTGPNPVLSNSGAPGTPVVRINGNYTEVTGFTIDAGGTADGIATVDAALAPRTVDSFVITNNTIQSAIQAMDIRSNTTPGATGPTTMPDVRSLTFDDNIGVISNNTISGLTGSVPGVTEGIVVVHSGGADPLNLRVASNTITNVTDEGIDLSVTAGTIDASDTNFGILSNTVNASGVGILASANGLAATFNLAVQGNTVANSTDAVNPLDPTVGAGMIFLGQGLGTMNIESFLSNTVTNNGVAGGRGAAFVASGGFLNIQPTTPGQVPFANNAFTGNADDGVLFAGQNLGVMNVGTIAQNAFTGNGGDGIDIRSTTGALVNVGPIVANQIQANLGNGINGLADGGAANLQVGSNLAGAPQSAITGNTLNGINLETANAGTLNGVIQNVAVSNNLQNGVRIASPSGTANVQLDGTPAANNLITGNGIDGVAIVGTLNGTINVTSMTNNTITGNVNDGIDVNLSGAAVATLADVSGNTVTNGAFGMRVTQIGTSVFNLNMGASGAANGLNQFANNVDAGVGMSLEDNAAANIVVTNSVFSGTTNSAATTLFNGEGFHVRLIDNATLANATFGDAALTNTAFLNNVGSGLALFADGDAQITNPVVQNTVFTNNGTIEGDAISVSGAFVPTDGDAGFRVIRQGNGVIDNVVVNNNTFTGNANGILAVARNGNLTDEYTITNNTILDSDFRGIALRAEFDADITALIQSNTITNSGNEGIQTTERRNSVGDSLSVDLQVFDNIVEDSGNLGVVTRGQGIEISAFHNNVTIGSNANAFPDNIIRNNLGDGIEINQSGTAFIRNNLIFNNGGDAGIDLNAASNTLTIDNNQIVDNAADGIELTSLGLNTLMNVTVTNNIIRLNGQDGIEVVSQSQSANTVNITTNNLIEDNTGRGVAIFNRGNGADITTNLTVNLNNNTIQRNGEEGVYVVNTSSTTQSSDVASTVTMDATGSVFSDPRLIFNMNANNVRDNGVLSGFPGTGLVVRVGTSDASRSFADPGGFANARGGIVASVTNNQFGGNAGADVYFDSFVSTVTPNTTTGSWTDQNENPRNNANDTFQVNGEYQSDPLARLDLTFGGNVGEELDATNQGASYNNNEAVFKSRTQGQDNGTDGGLDDNGPFSTGTRVRNAQRLAGRDFLLNNLPPDLTINGVSGNSDNFLFSGVGESTFRVDIQPGNVFGTITSNFLLDADPYNNPATDANGVGPYGGGPEGIDNMPWGWSTLP